jgi:hypothetical protein
VFTCEWKENSIQSIDECRNIWLHQKNCVIMKIRKKKNHYKPPMQKKLNYRITLENINKILITKKLPYMT